jgi:hypothetical protein
MDHGTSQKHKTKKNYSDHPPGTSSRPHSSVGGRLRFVLEPLLFPLPPNMFKSWPNMPPLGGESGRVARLTKGGLPDPLAVPSGGRGPG